MRVAPPKIGQCLNCRFIAAAMVFLSCVVAASHFILIATRPFNWDGGKDVLVRFLASIRHTRDYLIRLGHELERAQNSGDLIAATKEGIPDCRPLYHPGNRRKSQQRRDEGSMLLHVVESFASFMGLRLNTKSASPSSHRHCHGLIPIMAVDIQSG